ncbi:type II toxin-antitoxin system VapB family antitoxin [Rhizobium sp. 32-5/1]|uniref:type II toxin-antitoxin system VapB family antitoxin n=1 Tax=Rhizobium sp. 32-5/1 TaxID=3019602 RepID=UPI00240E330A|nr:type II toxin-antitoxin system VapB family antitoxin [Rhizobium sp. 32-5/1]WEZ83885.1 type II toxin-antitoxin system VapB family antitoxin [Rhizobium sp. 32-5/1]
MPLYVRDDSVNDLAAEAQRVLKTRTKTEAIRIALERVIAAEENRPPLMERLKKLQDRFAAFGPRDPNFDQKAYLDEMWGND